MSTSKLQRKVSNLLSTYCGKYTIRENYRPDWLIGSEGERLELDFFIEELDAALEIQGEQHHSFVPFFHGTEEGFEKRKRLDSEKKQRCIERGVNLYYVYSEMDAIILVEKLKAPYEYEMPVMTGQEITREPRTKKTSVLDEWATNVNKLKEKSDNLGLNKQTIQKVKQSYNNPMLLRRIRQQGLDDLANWIESISA